MRRSYLFYFILFILVLPGSVAMASDSKQFPVPVSLKPAVDFWTRVYTEVTTDGGFIHDDRRLDVVYEVLRFPSKYSHKAKEKKIKRVKKKYKKILLTLSKGKRKGLSSEERRILALWPKGVSNQELKRATNRLRFQLGQANHYKAGLIRSGRWRTFIRKTFRDMGLPERLASLPHVESSFNPAARSHVGASGLWQFTRSTGRRFLRIDHVIDERLDPYKASRAAAKLLQHNYTVTGTWPLALTAYNHGAAGMRRAARKLGTKNIATIVRRYKSRSFGFASRNFYTAFLAASSLDNNRVTHFGKLKLDDAEKTDLVQVPSYVPIKTLQKSLGISISSIKKYNPDLLSPIWNQSKYVPKGYMLRVASNKSSKSLKLALAKIPNSQRHSRQRPDRSYRVRRGNTLSQIATRFGIDVRELVALNGLRSQHRIRVGQVLKLPQGKHDTIKVASNKRVKSTRSFKAKKNKFEVAKIPEDGLYKVRPGDTLSKIGKKYKIKLDDLLAYNDLNRKKRIYVGQTLVLAQQQTKPESVEEKQLVALISAEPDPMDKSAKIPEVEEVQPGKTVEPEEPLEGGVPTEVQDELSADPSDYSVASDNSIEVQAEETLGHYAEWLDLRASRIRRMNKLRYRKKLSIGKRLKLDFTRVKKEKFESKRLAYHRELQTDFFEQFQISGTKKHKVRRGESLWSLSKRKYDIPVWLLRQYNPDIDLASVKRGMRLEIPQLEKRESIVDPPEDSTDNDKTTTNKDLKSVPTPAALQAQPTAKVSTLSEVTGERKNVKKPAEQNTNVSLPVPAKPVPAQRVEVVDLIGSPQNNLTTQIPVIPHSSLLRDNIGDSKHQLKKSDEDSVMQIIEAR